MELNVLIAALVLNVFRPVASELLMTFVKIQFSWSHQNLIQRKLRRKVSMCFKTNKSSWWARHIFHPPSSLKPNVNLPSNIHQCVVQTKVVSCETVHTCWQLALRTSKCVYYIKSFSRYTVLGQAGLRPWSREKANQQRKFVMLLGSKRGRNTLKGGLLLFIPWYKIEEMSSSAER